MMTWISPPAPLLGGWLWLDAAGRLLLLITSLLFLAIAGYGMSYLRRETHAAHRDFEEAFVFVDAPEARFTGCLLLFLAAMTLVTVSQHFGILWVAIETTTLASAPLIFFHRHHRSLEATWKYLLLCSVGIALALLGNFFLAVAATQPDGTVLPLVVGDLVRDRSQLHDAWLNAAFLLLLVGYGTKMELAPLHTWLPDAHSEAPSMVSALLSGALLNCAFLGIVRVLQVCAAAGDLTFGRDLLVGFGLVKETVQLFAVLAYGSTGMLAVTSTAVTDAYPALTPDCAQTHWFEREIAEQWGVRPEGHPWLKPIRFHESYRSGHEVWSHTPGHPSLPSVTDFFQVQGQDVHEVAVGPVHTGIIEPGHFRFQCYGEEVFHLEISLGYQHRGVERMLVGGPTKRTIHYMETLAGDTSIGHATAYCHAVEALTGCRVPVRAHVVRAIALELERLANHTGDLGALAGDIGYLPTASYCGRIRGDFLNLTALLCGSRFGRGLVRPGGVGFEVEATRVAQCQERLERAMSDVTGAVALL
jgi:hypothetical protein